MQGNIEVLGLVRARNVALCGVHALATYLFTVFTVQGRSPPNPTKDLSAWSTFMLFSSSADGQDGVQYKSMAYVMKACFVAYKVFINKVTHAPRKAGAKLLDLLG